MNACDTTQLQIELAFRRATCRPPTVEEQRILVQSFERSLQRFSDDPNLASQFVNVGESINAKDLDETRLAALTAVTSVILNLDETITKE